jgi:hypothetical protein
MLIQEQNRAPLRVRIAIMFSPRRSSRGVAFRIEIEVAQGLEPGKVASTDPVGAAPVQRAASAEVPAEEVEVLALRVLGSSDSVHGVAMNIS